VKGLKLLSEYCFCHFEIKNCFQIAVLRKSYMKKSRKFACHAIDSLPTLQISLEIVALFKNIYDGEPILTSSHLKYRGGCTIPLFQLGV
jgi:hypothetical protein